MADKLISKKEAAAMLGVSERTVERLTAAGTFDAYKIASRTKYRESDIQTYINLSRRPAKRKAAPKGRSTRFVPATNLSDMLIT